MLQGHAIITGIIVAVLLGAAFVFYFRLQGYSTLAFVCLAAAIVVAILGFATAIIGKVVSVIVVIVLALMVVAEIPVLASSSGNSDYTQRYAIVLGAKVNGTYPSNALLYRLEGALDYLERNPSSIAIVSGGQNDDEGISEAACMRAWLIEHGIASDRIVMEENSFSTKQNLANSFEIIRSMGGDPSRDVAVVSSAYHLYRATLIAQDLGASVRTVSCECGVLPLAVNYYIREAAAVWACWLHASGI